MEGCSAPLVVKFADTQREKEQKKVHQMHTAFYSSIKGSNAQTGTLTIAPGVAITSDTITNSLTGANGSTAQTASLPLNMGLNSSGKKSKCCEILECFEFRLCAFEITRKFEQYC